MGGQQECNSRATGRPARDDKSSPLVTADPSRLGRFARKRERMPTNRWCLTLKFSFRGGLSWRRHPPALRALRQGSRQASPFEKGGLRGICPPWRPPSERAAGDETGNHWQTETLPTNRIWSLAAMLVLCLGSASSAQDARQAAPAPLASAQPRRLSCWTKYR